MNISKARFVALGASVIGLGIILGTFLWLKLTPRNISAWNTPALEGLNNYGAVPEFSLVERSGKSVTLEDLRGQVWIADFIYTTCQDTCPMQSAAMTRLQEQWADKSNLKLVSFTVDPERDTPAALARYAERFKANADRWLFLTGDKEQIARLVQGGFRLSAAALTDSRSKAAVIMHSPRFVLVDRKSEIRGYYDSRESTALERLNRDIAILVGNRGSS
jgi:cytochrome oxidase Cu insertion factor (SCO1/SenC/PrrC family)